MLVLKVVFFIFYKVVCGPFEGYNFDCQNRCFPSLASLKTSIQSTEIKDKIERERIDVYKRQYNKCIHKAIYQVHIQDYNSYKKEYNKRYSLSQFFQCYVAHRTANLLYSIQFSANISKFFELNPGFSMHIHLDVGFNCPLLYTSFGFQ